MAFIKDDHRPKIARALEGLEHEVKLLVFTQELECAFCETTREIAQELAGLSEKITAEVRDFIADAELAKEHGVDKIPAIVVLGEKDYGVRFFGMPAGYEFASLLGAVKAVARRDPWVADDVRAELAKIDRPVRLQVMITLTCPYCPAAVHAAHKLAMASDNVTADMVETAEFPHLAVKYGVQGVPNTVINETPGLVGAVPEPELVKAILKELGKA